jgi:hypothetical protein
MTTNNQLPQPITTSPWSIVSLISGISSYMLLPFLGGIIALITGYVAKREIKSSNGALSGSGMATAGLWLVGIIGGFAGFGPISDWINNFGY